MPGILPGIGAFILLIGSNFLATSAGTSAPWLPSSWSASSLVVVPSLIRSKLALVRPGLDPQPATARHRARPAAPARKRRAVVNAVISHLHVAETVGEDAAPRVRLASAPGA